MYGYEHVGTAKGDLHMVELCTAAILVNPAAQPLVELEIYIYCDFE